MVESLKTFPPLDIPYEHINVNNTPMSLLTGSTRTYDLIKNMEVGPNDVFLASFPKSGTTWLLHIVYHIMHHGTPPEGAKVDESIPWIDCDPYSIPALGPQRLFKTHMPFDWLPFSKNTKYIYVARNAKDVAISFYYFIENMQRQVPGYRKENEIGIPQFIDLFHQGKVLYGSWWRHVESWYTAHTNPNVLIVTYEELQADLAGKVREISSFLGVTLEDDIVSSIVDKCTFGSMRKDKKASMAYCTNFWRKGVCGDWVNHFSEEQGAKFDKKCEEELDEGLVKRLEFKEKEGLLQSSIKLVPLAVIVLLMTKAI